MHYFLAVEEDQEQENTALCQPITPAPLGDDLPRFKQLLAELKGNEGDFYQGQLSRMALDYMEHRDDDTVMAIVNSLAGTPQAKADKKKEQLWQARLLLKLAEIQRREHEVLGQELAALRNKEHELFQALKGDPALEEIYATINEQSPQQISVRIELLIKAWARLFLDGDPGDQWLISTNNDTAAAPLIEANEAITNQLPSRLLRLPLPYIDMVDFSEKRQQWQEALAPVLEKLAILLPELAHNGIQSSSLADLTQQAAEWTKVYNQHAIWPEPAQPINPKQCLPTPHLEIYLLGCPLPYLLGKLCNESLLPAPGPYSHTLLATISNRSSSCK